VKPRKGGLSSVAGVLGAILMIVLGLVFGCGDNGIIIVQTNFGTITSNATCDSHGGQFPLRQENGLIVLVILGDSSKIFLSNGIQGSCGNLTAGSHATVQTHDQHPPLHATEVRLQ